MDELPIILVSNDLKYAMTPLKIKTFERAREYYFTQKEAVESGNLQIQQLVGVSDKLEKIKKYMQKYNAVKEDVMSKVKFCHVEEEDEPEEAQREAQSKRIINELNQQRDLYVPRYEDSENEEEGQQNGQQSTQKPPQINHKVESKIQYIQATQTQNFAESNVSSVAFDFDLRKKVTTFKEEWNMTQVKTAKREESINRSSEKMYKSLSLFQRSMIDNSIVELYGEKSVGKTALLMYFCETYAQKSNRKIYFVNCGGGITYKRFERLQTKCPNLEYRDSYILDHVLSVCKSAAMDEDTGCVAVDSLTNLLMEEQKTLIFLIKLFKIFSYLQKKGCKVILTNYLQQTFDHHEDDPLTNHYSYYCAVTSEFVTYKYFLSEGGRDHKVRVKMCRGGFVQAKFGIGDDGVSDLEVKKQGQRFV